MVCETVWSGCIPEGIFLQYLRGNLLAVIFIFLEESNILHSDFTVHTQALSLPFIGHSALQK